MQLRSIYHLISTNVHNPKGKDNEMLDSKLETLRKQFPSGSLSRRQFLKQVAAMGLSVSAFGLLEGRSFAQETAVLQWWDHFNPLEALHRRIWDAFQQANPGVRVDYTVLNPAEMGQALQLAFRSGQAPDVHSLAGLDVPASQLVRRVGSRRSRRVSTSRILSCASRCTKA
jgi:hypothetical protein